MRKYVYTTSRTISAFLLGVVSLAFSGTSLADTSPERTWPESRMNQKNGLGFGLGISPLTGTHVFYDHNLGDYSQLHIQVNANYGSAQNILGTTKIKASRNMLLATYRYFFTQNSGFYLGAGAGYADSKLEYSSTDIFSGAQTQYSSKMSGVFVLGEIGWQGRDGYYFHVGLQPAAYIQKNDNYDVNNIPDVSNHRSAADDYHNRQRELSQLTLGFGWFF